TLADPGPGQIFGWPGAASELLTGFTARYDRTLATQQAVALARAIVARPQLLLLDEPFSSLDPLLREELMAEVRRLAGEISAALVLVTHDVFEALALARRTIVLEDARLAESGELVSLLAAPRSRLLRQCAARIEKLRTGE
ncbi:MAG: AAA family ATPase, partial [Gammaproteobacteria bacterium]